MNDLPIPSGNNPVATAAQVNPSGGWGGLHKEAEPISSGPVEISGPKESGQDTEQLPPEIASLGVKMHPTTIAIPQSLQQLGVQPAAANVSMPNLTVTLPLTDDQIALGLTQSITSSYHWLAEWCIRRLKQFHVGLKKIHGSIIRVKQ